jgi:hypothetical protein
MPRYFFSIHAVDGGFSVRAIEDRPAESSAELNDDAAALDYACRLVRELMQSPARTDSNSYVTVRDETRPLVFSIPFLAACA